MSKKIMPWLDVLPQFQQTGYPQRRDEIEGLMAEAAWLSRRAEELRSKAYFASLRLEGDAKARWTVEAVEDAKRSVMQGMAQTATEHMAGAKQ